MGIGERCSKCKIGLMIHIKLNTWVCNNCGYGYTIDPASGAIDKYEEGLSLWDEE